MVKKRKIASALRFISALFIIFILAGVSNVVPIEAQEPSPVWAFHDSHNAYFAGPFEDSIASVPLNGFYEKYLPIRPMGGGVDIEDPRITIESTYSEDYFPERIANPGGFSYSYSGSEPYQYEWFWGGITIPDGSEASVMLTPTKIPVRFNPMYEAQRIVDPVKIKSSTEVQTLTITFKPLMNFFNVHVFIHLWETDEAVPSVVAGSASTSSPTVFSINESPEHVDWFKIGPIVQETEYTFTVDLMIERKVSEPILYKPIVFIKAFHSPNTIDIGDSDSVTVDDDDLQGTITYSGTDTNHWIIFEQEVNQVVFQPFSGSITSTPRIEVIGNGWFVSRDLPIPPDETLGHQCEFAIQGTFSVDRGWQGRGVFLDEDLNLRALLTVEDGKTGISGDNEQFVVLLGTAKVFVENKLHSTVAFRASLVDVGENSDRFIIRLSVPEGHDPYIVGSGMEGIDGGQISIE